MSQAAFLKTLITIFGQSTISYHQYLDAGKTFRFAKLLKYYNDKALQLLIENKELSEKDFKTDIQALIIHYTEWISKWEQLASEKEHQPDDVFVFANDITFPKQAAMKLEQAYYVLNSQPASPQKN
jgi:hypothetical protein